MKKKLRSALLALGVIWLAIPALAVPAQAGEWKENEIGQWYERDDGSYPVSEWMRDGFQLYYFDDRGYLVSGWGQIDNVWYYFDENDKSMKANTWVGDYYVGSDGKMVTNAWIGGYWVGEDGKRTDPGKQKKSADAEKLTLSKTEVALYEGATTNLYVNTEAGVKVKPIAWISSNPAVAEVYCGKVAAKSEGTAQITAKIGKESVTCQISVYNGDVCKSALTRLGDQYIWGGDGPHEGGVDCSGLLMYAFTQNGYDFGADLNADNFGKYGEEVTREELRPGDAICCNFGDGRFQHIVLYLGDNMVVAAESNGPTVCSAGLYCDQHVQGTVCSCVTVKRPLRETDLLNAKFVRMDAYKKA